MVANFEEVTEEFHGSHNISERRSENTGLQGFRPGPTQKKMNTGLKFRIKKVEGLYYPCSENKGDDQLRGYREADLRLCFRICNKPVFSRRGSSNISAE